MTTPKEISMEEFGPISADYFTGRRVESVSEGDFAAVWTIHFEGGGRLHNYDKSIKVPKAIVGAALTMQIMGGHVSEDDRTPLTELRFGMEAVKLNPLEYAMFDPNYTRGFLVYPQRSSVNMPTVTLPQHPDERVAEGPTGEEKSEPKKTKKKRTDGGKKGG